MNNNLGEVRIFFGTVVSIDDMTYSCRCQVKIFGKTDEIPTEELPWYFSWYGVNQLPKIGDEVPVIIFDNNLSTGFYGRPLVSTSAVDANNYKDYVRVFKSFSDDASASIEYTLSNGIDINNGQTGVNVNPMKLKLFSNYNDIEITDNRINIGNNKLQANLCGDDVIIQLKKMIQFQESVIDMMYGGFQQVMLAAMTSPFTAAIGAKLATFIPSQMQLMMQSQMLEVGCDSLQSETVFTGK